MQDFVKWLNISFVGLCIIMLIVVKLASDVILAAANSMLRLTKKEMLLM